MASRSRRCSARWTTRVMRCGVRTSWRSIRVRDGVVRGRPWWEVMSSRGEGAAAVHAQAGRGLAGAERRDVDWPARNREEIPQRRGSAVTQDPTGSEDRGPQPTVEAEPFVAHGVDPAMKGVQTASPDPHLDRAPAEPEQHELPRRDRTMLSQSELRDPRIAGSLSQCNLFALSLIHI